MKLVLLYLTLVYGLSETIKTTIDPGSKVINKLVSTGKKALDKSVKKGEKVQIVDKVKKAFG